MKRIAYLFGTGITQSETNNAGYDIRVLTAQIKDGIQIQLEKETAQIRDLIANDLSTQGVDIEQLISLYESTGTSNDNEAAHFLRRAFVSELVNRLDVVDKSTERFQPVLISALLELHKKYDKNLDERLLGIITLNYDDFAERALDVVYSGFDYGFKMHDNANQDVNSISKSDILLLKLHGSFNWGNEFPPVINATRNTDPEKCLWIPPGVEKKKEKYPFNILWGKAKEILDCDILRVIGCSLSRNDWQLISLLHTAKRVRGLQIEFINYEDVAKDKDAEYPYLGIVTMLEIDGFRKYFSTQTSIRESGKSIEDFSSSTNATQFNCFREWLKFRKFTIESQDNIDFESSVFIKQI